MKYIRILSIAWLIIACLALSAGTALGEEATPDDGNISSQAGLWERGYVPDHLLVGFRPGTAPQVRDLVHRERGARVLEDIAGAGVQVVAVPAGQVERLASEYRRDPAVAFVEPDYLVRAAGTPNDPSYGQQWALSKIQAATGWNVTMGSSSVVIAILDTGISASHPDLAGKVVPGYNYIANSTNTNDDHGHGTHVAGIAAAATNNGIGVAGVGYNSRLMPVKVLDANGSGTYSALIAGITYAADHGARVINMSLGGSASSEALQNAVNYAWGKGVVLVAAAGNEGTGSVSYPAALNNVVAVAASDQNDNRASFSNYGAPIAVAAPGVSILSTVPGGYASWSGTSMATPHVAGLAALLSAQGKGNADIRATIQGTADDLAPVGKDAYTGYGRINVARAVASTGGGPPGGTGDLVPPTVSITSPANGATVKGYVTVRASAGDNVGVSRVVFLVDGTVKATDYSASYQYDWNSKTVTDGTHTVAARAYDAAGNSTTTSVVVSVNQKRSGRGTAPPPTPTTSPTPIRRR